MEEKNFTQQNPKHEKAVTWIDHEMGLIHIPGKGALPLVGPTTGREYERLKLSEAEKIQFNTRWYAIACQRWKCTQCGRVCRRLKFAGGRPLANQSTPIIRWRKPLDGGPEREILCCPFRTPRWKGDTEGPTCDAPMSMVLRRGMLCEPDLETLK